MWFVLLATTGCGASDAPSADDGAGTETDSGTETTAASLSCAGVETDDSVQVVAWRIDESIVLEASTLAITCDDRADYICTGDTCSGESGDQLDIPADTAPGTYDMKLEAEAERGIEICGT